MFGVKQFKPLLAATLESIEDLSSLRLPLYLSEKIDGIRAISDGNGVISRTLKRIPNNFINSSLKNLPKGLEGEICKLAKDGTVCDFEDTESAVMSKGGQPKFSFYLFDSFQSKFEPYLERYKRCCQYYQENVHPIRQHYCRTLEDIKKLIYQYIKVKGSEGVMLRENGFYKFGRSTLNEQLLLKLKPWNTDEAIVLDVLEEFENTNPSLSDDRGYSKRSKHRANLKGKNTMGALLVKSKKFGEFRLGSGWTKEGKQNIFDTKLVILGVDCILQYRYRGVSKYNKPRHASFVRWMN